MPRANVVVGLCLVMFLLVAGFLLTPAGAAGPTITDLHSFQYADGTDPNFLFQSSDGNFYGTTYWNGGSVFGITPGGKFSLLYRFLATNGKYLQGEYPVNVVEGPDGFLYGAANSGGPNLGVVVASPGNLFKVSKSGTGFEIVHAFCSAPNCSDGAGPNNLILGSDGNFYGTTAGGGSFQGGCQYYGCGVLFRLSPDGTYTVLYTPQAGQIGLGGLMQATDGNFYAICRSDTGGPPEVCRVTTSGQVSSIFQFPSTLWPVSGLTQGSNGLLYGSALINPNSNTFQTIYQLNTSGGSFEQLYQTSIQCCVKIGYSRVIQASDGNLWITNPNAQLWGTVYSITPTGTLLQTIAFSGPNGHSPHYLIQASSGLLYGATYSGGTSNYGVVFSINAGLPPK
jgi:hypothetical protein